MLDPHSNSNKDIFKAHSADSSPIAKEKNAHQLQSLSPLFPPKQRHSTGNLTTDVSRGRNSRPTKGILKMPHTFNQQDRQKPSLSPTAGVRRHEHFTFPSSHNLIENQRPSMQSNKKNTGMLASDMGKLFEDSQKLPQRVEFSETDAVAVFGDTTTDTENGLDSPSVAKFNEIGSKISYRPKQNFPQQTKTTTMLTSAQRKNGVAPPAAIVSPYIRQQNVPPTQTSQNSAPLTSPEISLINGSTADHHHQKHEWSPDVSESSENSIRSGGNSQSHIVGKWWFGPSTKFVVHCDRRSCSHGRRSQTHDEHAGATHSHQSMENIEPYLTPTQRHQKEVAAIKKELRRSEMACREKERHLRQLRDRLSEIETMLSSSSDNQMAQLAQMRQKMIEQEEEFVKEREALIARHEHKMRQIVQETVDLRAELARKGKALAERNRIQYRDQSVQVEPEKIEESITTIKLEEELSPIIEKNTDKEIVVENNSGNALLSLSGATSQSAPVSPSKAPILQIGTEVLATLEAYRSETIVWRTRCANLELIMQDLLLREGTRAGDAPLGSTLFINLESGNLDDGGEMEANDEFGGEKTATEKPAAIEREQSLQPAARKPIECQMANCLEKKRKLREENDKLMEQVNMMENELDTLRQRNMEVEIEMQKMEADFTYLSKKHTELAELAETRLNETKALKLTSQSVQLERDKFQQAIVYLERRCEALELIGLDQGIVLEEEPLLCLEIDGPLSREFKVRGSKATQTALTVDDLGLNERTMDELQIRLRVMQTTFAKDKAQMGLELAEIERILELKTQLVNTLTDQLDEAARRSRAEDEQHQRERDMFMARIEELGRVAERVPILESEIEKALVDKSRCELRLRDVEDQLDDAMDQALDSAMDRSRIREEYWAERLDTVDRERRDLKAKLEHERCLRENERMKWSLEKAKLDRRLTSAIEHISLLNARINCPRRDAQCEVRPRTQNKYVICRPNQKDQTTGAELCDAEMEELKMATTTLASERELLLAEIAELTKQAYQAMAMIQMERLSKMEKDRGPADFLTVSFHRKSELVEFGGSSGRGGSTQRTYLSTPAGVDAISMVSLPTVLDYFGTTEFNVRQYAGDKTKATVPPFIGKPRSSSIRSGILSEEDEEDLHNSKHRELSLPPPTMMTNSSKLLANNKPQLSLIRCHSAPRRQKTDWQQLAESIVRIENGNSQIVQQNDETLNTGMQIPTIQITSAEEIRCRVQTLRLQMENLMRTGVRNEIPCSIAEGELFDQLDAWLCSMAETNKWSWQSQQQIESLKRENGNLRERLKDAEMELWIYRTEPRRAAQERREGGFWRSFSAEFLGTPPLATKQLGRWKEIAGTCFREVNQLRKRLHFAEEERLSLRNQVAILKGELAIAKCEVYHSVLMKRKNSFDGTQQETLKSYNRWLGRDRWQSVPDLDEEEEENKMINWQDRGQRRRKTVTNAKKEKEIVNEALRRQFSQLKKERDQLAQREQNVQEELLKKQKMEEELNYQLKKVNAEFELLQRENGMYEQKLVEMDRDRQQMYLVMFRKGQQAANQEIHDDLDKAAELKIVLRFLHDAFFYYLLNKGNAREHLQAIMTMLNFTPEQKEEVYRRRGKSH